MTHMHSHHKSHVQKWNPFDDLLDIQRDIGKFFRRSVGFGSEAVSAGLESARGWAPAVDIYTTDGALKVKAELPGVMPNDIDVSLSDGQLVIKGERKSEKEMNEKNVYRMETSYGKFQRTITLPKEVKAEDIKASYKDGVLTVEVPGAMEEEEKEPKKKIDVEIK